MEVHGIPDDKMELFSGHMHVYMHIYAIKCKILLKHFIDSYEI